MNNLRDKDGLTEEEFLKKYDASKFDKPSVTVDLVIFTIGNEDVKNYRKLPKKELKVLLRKRTAHPYLGCWGLPGGFVKTNESLEEAVERELKEKANINLYMEQLYTWGDVKRDPRTRVISCSYMALAENSSIKALDDKNDDLAEWLSVKRTILEEKRINNEKGFVEETIAKLELSNEDENLYAVIKTKITVQDKVRKIERHIVESEGIAFDHAQMIDYSIERLKNKIEYTDIAFNLMPEYFTLTELQQVYEVILDKELLKANFRRKVAHMVIETDKYTSDMGHRPSQLFRYNPNWKLDTF